MAMVQSLDSTCGVVNEEIKKGEHFLVCLFESLINFLFVTEKVNSSWLRCLRMEDHIQRKIIIVISPYCWSAHKIYFIVIIGRE